MENYKEFLGILKQNPVIPCTDNFNELMAPRFSNVKVVLLHSITIYDLLKVDKKNNVAKKIIILNIDSLKGIKPDEYGLDLIKRSTKINIISSSLPKTVERTKKMGLTIMQTILLFDTKSIKTGIKLLGNCKPDMVDIRPSTSIPKIIDLLKIKFKGIPIICSGLIDSKEDIDKLLNYVTAITTSKIELWDYFL